MTKKKQLFILLFTSLICLSSKAQTYYKKIQFISNHFSQPLPRGYKFYVTGPIDPGIGALKLTITQGSSIESYVWERQSPYQTDFEFFVTNPLDTGKFSYVLNEPTSGTPGAKGFVLTGATLTFTTDPPTSEDDESTNPTSRWSLVSGFGYAILGRGKNTDRDMFGYVAARFRLNNWVNKTKKFIDNDNGQASTKVYRDYKDRFCLLVGGANSKMGFKGKELLNPVYGIKPMVGASFDIVPEASIDAGMLFYDYQKGNASLYTELDSKIGIGIFVSLSVDFDVFTRIKFATENKKYNQSAN